MEPTTPVPTAAGEMSARPRRFLRAGAAGVALMAACLTSPALVGTATAQGPGTSSDPAAVVEPPAADPIRPMGTDPTTIDSKVLARLVSTAVAADDSGDGCDDDDDDCENTTPSAQQSSTRSAGSDTAVRSTASFTG